MRCPLPSPLDLAASFEGQAFRWRLEDGWWTGPFGRTVVRLQVRTENGDSYLDLESASTLPSTILGDLRCYLGLDTNVDAIRAQLVEDPCLVDALALTEGLRLLRQDPWETLVCFILSQNSNIPRIQQNVEDLARLAGGPVEAWERLFYTFPTAGAVASLDEETLRGLRLGYRAPSLLLAARRVAEGDLDLEGLRRLSYEKAKAALRELPGVGPKVADCVLAYGLGFGEAFPVDTWVEKAVLRRWLPEARLSREKLAAWGRERFGPHAAYAQQVLFYAERRAL